LERCRSLSLKYSLCKAWLALMTTRHFGTSSESRPDLSSLRELSSWRKRSSPFDPYHGYSANLFPEYQCAPWSSSRESSTLFTADLRATVDRGPLGATVATCQISPGRACLRASCSRVRSGMPPLRRPTPRPTPCRARRLRRSCRASSTICRSGSEDSPRASPPRPPAGPAA
jgi:hypothetical protein